MPLGPEIFLGRGQRSIDINCALNEERTISVLRRDSLLLRPRKELPDRERAKVRGERHKGRNTCVTFVDAPLGRIDGARFINHRLHALPEVALVPAREITTAAAAGWSGEMQRLLVNVW